MNYNRKDLREAYTEGFRMGQELAAQKPVIAVSEISRLLVNLRKRKLKARYYVDGPSLKMIEEVREVLELRRRSRQGASDGTNM